MTDPKPEPPPGAAPAQPALQPDAVATARLGPIYAVLSETNEAMLRATDAPQLYRGVCDAAVASGKFRLAVICLPVPDGSQAMQVVAEAGGADTRLITAAALSVDPDSPRGQGLVGNAFRGARAAVSNDFHADPRLAPWRALQEQAGVRSGAAVPIATGGAVIGVLLVYSAEAGAFDIETVRLIERMARNIGFALDNFAREGLRRAAERHSLDSERRYLGVLASMQECYYEVDLGGRHLFFNDAFPAVLGYRRAEVIGSTNRDFQTPEMARRVGRIFKQVFDSGEPRNDAVWAYRHRDGHTISVEGSVHLKRDTDGQPVGYYGVLRDVTERLRMDRALRDSEARFRALTNLSSDWYWEFDAELRYVAVEGRRSVERVRSDFIGRYAWEAPLVVVEPNSWTALRAELEAHRPFRDVVMHRTLPGGRPFYVATSGEPVFDGEGRFTGYRGISREITQQTLAEGRVRYLATHDALTGLANRTMFGQLLAQAIEQSQRYGRGFAVLFIDLDRFKWVNDSLGHAAGDTLLRGVAARFRAVLRASDTLARLGGDEFVVLLNESAHEEAVVAVAQKLLDAASRPMAVQGHDCRVTASIGIACHPQHGGDEATLMRNADIAMYFAKDRGKNNFQFYSDSIEAQSVERLALEGRLRHALERGELHLHYQPKVDLASGAITGVEALLRWDSAQLGSVSPARFIPVAEETGLIKPIGRWVLREACSQATRWQQQGLPPLCVAVNLSARQFEDGMLLDELQAVLEGTGLPPGQLELEITEGMVIGDAEHAGALLRAIQALGVRIAVDDFGTGYSSLAQLKRFPIDTIKVDRSFIRDIADNAEDQAITGAIIAMARNLSLEVVAEGVETEAQRDWLRERGCDAMQGYLFSRPVPPDALAALLQKQ